MSDDYRNGAGPNIIFVEIDDDDVPVELPEAEIPYSESAVTDTDVGPILPEHIIYHEDFVVLRHRGVVVTFEASQTPAKKLVHVRIRLDGIVMNNVLTFDDLDDARAFLLAVSDNDAVTEDGCINLYTLLHGETVEEDEEEGE